MNKFCNGEVNQNRYFQYLLSIMILVILLVNNVNPAIAHIAVEPSQIRQFDNILSADISWSCITTPPDNYPVASYWGEPVQSTYRHQIMGRATYLKKLGSYHLGEDIEASANELVKSVTDGVVACTGLISDFGHVVMVQSLLPGTRQHITVIYGHMRSTGLATIGTLVKKGDNIGVIGTSSENGGYSEHLHVGIRVGHYAPIREDGWKTSHWGYIPLSDPQEFSYWRALSDYINNPPAPEKYWQAKTKVENILIPWWQTVSVCTSKRVKVYIDEKLILYTSSLDGNNPHSHVVKWLGFGGHNIKILVYDVPGASFDHVSLTAWPARPICAAESEMIPVYPDDPIPVQNTTPPPGSISDSATVTALSIPDGTLVSPNENLTKTWQLKNDSAFSWGIGYKLVFTSGEQMGAPGETDIPTTAPNQTVDLSISITSPTTSGEHTGYFQLRNPQGTYFGPKISVKINVRSASSKIIVLSADPVSPADTGTVRFTVKVEGIANFRAMRLMVDGQQQGEHAGPEYTFTWNTSGFAGGAHNIAIEATDQTDLSWIRPEVRSMSYTLLGTAASPNLKPNAPTLTNPYDWHVYYSGNTAQLCAEANGDPDGDEISAYYFDIYGSAQLWNSGWSASHCVTTGALGPYNYKWHVKVRDSRGAESDWSADRNFTLVNPALSITDLSFQPQDGNSEVVKIRACTSGQAGIGITMRVDVNDANDGSANGQWHRIKELSVPCFNDTDAPLWQTLEAGGNYGDGSHLVRVEAHGLNTGWNGAAVREAVYTLPHRRPSGFSLVSPVSASGNTSDPVFLNSPSITFQWGQALRATNYTLSVSTSPNPAGASNPLFRQTFDSNTTQFTVVFDQNYPVLYWQVRATNDKGSMDTGSQLIGIDVNSPVCSIQPLTTISYENNFQVIWSGSDTPSGIRSFDIQYLDSTRGEWSDWLTSVPNSKTFELFIGQAGHSYGFRCRAMDNAGNIGEYPEEADQTVKIDPAARPPEAWWQATYATKRNITIQNNMPGSVLPANYPVKVVFTSGTSPSAADVYNASLSVNKCDDLRIVYANTTELNRYIKKCAPDEIEIWYRTMGTIPGGGTSMVYQMYLGNPSATTPPGDAAQIWYPYKESDTSNLYLFQEGGGSTAYDNSGNGRNCSINPSVQWGAGKWGSALVFNRANNGDMVSLTCGSPYPLSAFTVEFWYKPNIDTDGRIAGQLGPSGQLSWLVSIESDRMKFERWCTGCGGQARGNISFRNSLYYNKWNYLALTFDGSNVVKFYVNGILDNTVTLDGSGMATYNIPLSIGSVEGMGQGKYYIGAFRLSKSVKTDFYPGTFANITNEPSFAVGTIVLPPSVGTPDLAIVSLNAYPDPSGGILVEAVIKNQGTLSTNNGFFTDLYLDHLPAGAGDYSGSLQFWVNDPIPAGGMMTLTTVITDLSQIGLNALIPGEEKRGTLYVQTDSTGALTETDKANNITSGTEVCVVAPDAFEGDETSATAHLLGANQLHNLDRPNDEDWVKLDAKQGQTYTIQTSSLGPNADTYLYLYGPDGTTLLASNDDFGGSLSSQIEWTAPADDTYYLQIKQWNPSSGGCGTGYTIGAGGIQPAVFLPVIVR